LPIGRCLSDTDRLTEERVRELMNLKEIRATKIGGSASGRKFEGQCSSRAKSRERFDVKEIEDGNY